MHSISHEDPLDDETNRHILMLASRQELTGPMLAYMLDLPISECYRRVAALTKADYLNVVGYKVSARRRAHKLYRTKMEGVEIFYRHDTLVMRVPKRTPDMDAVEIEIVVPPRRRLQ